MASEESSAPAVTRATAILDLVAEAKGRALSISEIARTLGLPKSSTSNLCQALELGRLLARREQGYVLGRRLVELGGAYLSTVDQVQEFYSTCRKQRIICRLTARVAVLDGLEVLYLARYDGTQPIRLTANIGDRFPAHCTATGKALLAMLEPGVLAERLRGKVRLAALTDKSITDIAELYAELDATRERGYGLDQEETTPGVTCVAIATPGFRTDSDPFAISVTAASASLGSPTLAELLAELRAVASALSNPMLVRS